MSYLPLCFVGTQILDMWVAISVAGTVYFPSLEAGVWSGLPRAPGTVSAGGKSDNGLMWAAKERGQGVGRPLAPPQPPPSLMGLWACFPRCGRQELASVSGRE